MNTETNEGEGNRTMEENMVRTVTETREDGNGGNRDVG